MSGAVIRIDLGFVNAYLIEAEGGFVLVDTGMAGQLPRLKAGLEAAGCGKGGLRLLVLSHADADHVGNVAAIAEEFGVPIALHEADAPALVGGEAPRRHVRGLLGSLLIALLPKPRVGGGGPRPRVDLLLKEGDSLADYGLKAKVLHLPGHTPGSIALLLEDGDLVAGDVLSNRRRPGPSPFIWDTDQYRASLERLRGLAATIGTVYPGHGSPFEGSAIGGVRL